MTATDRYLLLGAPVPVIYHGTVEHMRQAMRDAQDASRGLPGQHCLFAISSDRAWRPIRVYEDGECTWVYRRS